MLNVGLNIKKIREIKNLTQDYVASCIGMTQSAYSKLESGDTSINITRLEKIANILEVKIEDIVHFKQERLLSMLLGHERPQSGVGSKSKSVQLYELELENEHLRSENTYLRGLLEQVIHKLDIRINKE